MLEILNQIRDENFYHPLVLCLLGNAFINDNSKKDIIFDAECLQALGTYLINKLKQQSHAIPERTLFRIALAKRWDTSEKSRRSFKTFLNKPSSDYQSIIDTRLAEAIKANSLAQTVFNILLKALEYAPQKHNEIEAIKERVNNSDLMESLDYLVGRLSHLDTMIKEEDLKKRFTETNDPNVKCTFSIYMAANYTYGLSMDLVTENPFENVNKDELIKSNVNDITFLSNFMIDQITKNGFFTALSTHATCTMAVKQNVDTMLIDFWRDASKTSHAEIQDLLKYIKELLTTIEFDMGVLNSNSEIFEQLLSAFKTEPLKAVSTELIAIVELRSQKLIELITQFENSKSNLVYLKEIVESLENALSLSSSELFKKLQQMFRDFDARFADPPNDMLENLKNLQSIFLQISSSVITIKTMIKGKDETSQKSSQFNMNYLDYHTANKLLIEVQQYIEFLNEKSLKFNVEKDKCFAFEYVLNNLQGKIYEMDFDKETNSIKWVFLAATKSYERIWQVQIKCMYTTNVVTTIAELNKDLQALEGALSKVIKHREKVLQENAATPPPRIKDKSLPFKSQGTPRRAVAFNTKRNLQFEFFQSEVAPESKKPCTLPVEATAKENVLVHLSPQSSH